MPKMEDEGLTIKLDDEGYLADTAAWTEKVARALARSEGIKDLTEEQMSVIRFMRRYYLEFGSFPILKEICVRVRQPENCVTEEFMDPLKAWKIAGLPRPNDEVIAYLKRPL